MQEHCMIRGEAHLSSRNDHCAVQFICPVSKKCTLVCSTWCLVMYLKHFLDVLNIPLNVLYAFITLINQGIVILQSALQHQPLLLLLLLLHQHLMLISVNSRLQVQGHRSCCLLGLLWQTGCFLALGYLQCCLQVFQGCLQIDVGALVKS